MNVRRSIAVAATLLVAPLLSSCGFDAPTDQVYNPAVGVDDRKGQVDVLNALVVSGSDGSGVVLASLVNNDEANDDTLRGVSGARKDAGLTIRSRGESPVAAGGLTNLAVDGRVVVRGERVAPGNFVSLTFTFDRGEAITVDAPVVSADNPAYADVQVPAGS